MIKTRDESNNSVSSFAEDREVIPRMPYKEKYHDDNSEETNRKGKWKGKYEKNQN